MQNSAVFKESHLHEVLLMREEGKIYYFLYKFLIF